MDIRETEILGDDAGGHWYYESKAAILGRLISQMHPRAILDVGAGSGFFSRRLLEHTAAREAWCVDTGYLEDRDEISGGKPLHFRRRIDCCDADLVLLIDVLEHADDDVGLLSEYVRKVPGGATFVVSVPAFRFMWSPHDEFLRHKRRYTLRQIASVVRDSGLSAGRSTYGFAAIFPLALASRFATKALRKNSPPRSQLRRHSRFTHAMLRGLCRAELAIVPGNRLFGLSAFCVGSKG